MEDQKKEKQSSFEEDMMEIARLFSLEDDVTQKSLNVSMM